MQLQPRPFHLPGGFQRQQAPTKVGTTGATYAAVTIANRQEHGAAGQLVRPVIEGQRGDRGLIAHRSELAQLSPVDHRGQPGDGTDALIRRGQPQGAVPGP